MLIGRKKGWELPESEATPEMVYLGASIAEGDGPGVDVGPWAVPGLRRRSRRRRPKKILGRALSVQA